MYACNSKSEKAMHGSQKKKDGAWNMHGEVMGLGWGRRLSIASADGTSAWEPLGSGNRLDVVWAWEPPGCGLKCCWAKYTRNRSCMGLGHFKRKADPAIRDFEHLSTLSKHFNVNGHAPGPCSDHHKTTRYPGQCAPGKKLFGGSS